MSLLKKSNKKDQPEEKEKLSWEDIYADSKMLELHLDCQFARGINFRDRVITLSGTIESPMFETVEIALTELEAIDLEEPITVKLHSFGGNVDEALAIVGRIKISPCRIVTEGYGAIMSAATLILASGDKRRVSQFARFMHHCSSYDVSDITRHDEVKEFISTMEKEEIAWAEWMSKFSKKSKKFWRETGSKKDAYFTARQLLRIGVVDEIF